MKVLCANSSPKNLDACLAGRIFGYKGANLPEFESGDIVLLRRTLSSSGVIAIWMVDNYVKVSTDQDYPWKDGPYNWIINCTSLAVLSNPFNEAFSKPNMVSTKVRGLYSATIMSSMRVLKPEIGRDYLQAIIQECSPDLGGVVPYKGQEVTVREILDEASNDLSSGSTRESNPSASNDTVFKQVMQQEEQIRNQPVTLRPQMLLDAAESEGLMLPSAVYYQVVAALNSRKHVILTGPPGTGKTTLAQLTAQVAVDAGLTAGSLCTTATADWTTFDTIGGLLPNSTSQLEFKPGLFIQALEQNRWLVIDELNRSNFDRAFGQLFTVLSGQTVELQYQKPNSKYRLAIVPAGESNVRSDVDPIEVPDSWRIIATMNSFDKTLLFTMSYALMRRFAFIEVPSPKEDVLFDLIALESNGNQRAAQIVQTLTQLGQIKRFGAAPFLDAVRYVLERSQTSEADADITFECFYSFFLPQFEGIDEGKGRDLFDLMRALVGPRTEELRNSLSEVLGLEGLNQAVSSISDFGDNDSED